MAVEEQADLELRAQLRDAIGPEVTERLMARLPHEQPGDLLSRGNLSNLEGRMDTLEGRMDRLEQRMDTLEQRMLTLEHQIEILRHEVIATVRGEIVTAVSHQTRMMLAGMMGTVISLGGLALAFARFV